MLENLILTKIPRKLYFWLYNSIFFHFSLTTELKKAIGNCQSLLDVGCGAHSPIKHLSNKLFCVGIDAFKPSIDDSKKANIHNEYRVMNILNIDKEFKPNSFECVLACDVIEHLTKKDGINLLYMMENIAQKRVIIFTPNGFIPQKEYNNNPWQIHKSGWTAEEMHRMGYKIIGINGWKFLRGEGTKIKFNPPYFWEIISEITQLLFTKKFPTHAFQVLCIKEK